jgi:S-adenosylmethionine-diacylgycerolhomoserine-N-methlytransferase
MSLFADAKILLGLLRPPRGDTHAERMESFYARQAAGYDAFRERLLPFRRDLYCDVLRQYLADEPAGGGTWLDLGGGTGGNIEYIAHQLHKLNSVWIVDLSPSLLDVAKARIQKCRWQNVRAFEADVTRFEPKEYFVDIITFSHSLTMISDWEFMIDRAARLLRPGGLIGVVDFYTSPAVAAPGMVQHDRWTRAFWPRWFAIDHVHLGPAQLTRLQQTFETVELRELRARVPYVPLGRVPHFTYIGRRSKNRERLD